MSYDNQNFLCLHCSVDTLLIGEYYMVEDDVWAQTGLSGSDGMLCIACLENSIGRTLNAYDFPDLPVNTSIHFPKSPRILSRILNI